MSYAIYPSLAGKSVIVTGGGSGIGAAMVEAFARQGARVSFVDVAEADALALVDSLRECAHVPRFHRCDLRDVASIERTFGEIDAAAGAIDILVNNAANDDRHAFADVTPAYWDERIAVNLRHQFFCAQRAAQAMKRAGKGVILNLGSISWHLALANLSIYMTAKAGIEGMTRGLARDLGGSGIRVNAIVPGAVKTPRQMKLWQSPESEAKLVADQCLQQRIEPEHVARMALFLASDDGERCSGREYFVDAGWYGAS
ncbi:SDR family oxidoreductase [Trinickia caryophylli]|uniref:D-xylose dehydrogenase n=1 Tax=Trinickia caryophylli TaxID=28094 RepID=A0A1X7DEY2_TRICW|nr:SDR family oxidoreductase [Trinickia caryophylli]PMS09809.1 SDR family NAD(P)-dependent oxidoreductase [Trinickia caryophylli]TRX16877.1 SDR family oxidoreductase [Trinickia caryophylli]WQE12393.1 SDR family oxidoreductase [Trinickia caryophylli]SMF14175.1 D-xylose dehydrogenase [Trinickia caryophylli]GLU31459.1 D-xylose 1-dehydrogenase [Trinickia caryophylli]